MFHLCLQFQILIEGIRENFNISMSCKQRKTVLFKAAARLKYATSGLLKVLHTSQATLPHSDENYNFLLTSYILNPLCLLILYIGYTERLKSRNKFIIHGNSEINTTFLKILTDVVIWDLMGLVSGNFLKNIWAECFSRCIIKLFPKVCI